MCDIDVYHLPDNFILLKRSRNYFPELAWNSCLKFPQKFSVAIYRTITRAILPVAMATMQRSAMLLVVLNIIILP